MNYFFAFTDNNNNDIATNFLIMANWDEKKAVEIYFSQQNNKNNPSQNSNDFKRGNIPSQNNNIQNPYQNPPSQSGYNSYVPPQSNNNRYNGQYQNPYIPSNNNNSNQFQQPFHQDDHSNNINEFHIYDELHKILSNHLTFGTAGLRGPMRAGYACMNNLTVQQASQVCTSFYFVSFQPRPAWFHLLSRK